MHELFSRAARAATHVPICLVKHCFHNRKSKGNNAYVQRKRARRKHERKHKHRNQSYMMMSTFIFRDYSSIWAKSPFKID